jgi:hypothetical protein
MTGLEVRAFRNEDNSVSMVVTIPPRRNGEPNFGALARINRELLMVDPAAFDPREDQSAAPIASYEEQAVAHHAIEAPMPPLVELHEGDDCPEEVLKGGEAYREHGA